MAQPPNAPALSGEQFLIKVGALSPDNVMKGHLLSAHSTVPAAKSVAR